MIYAILLFGLDIVVGYTGQVSLGHAGLFGIGAYTAGVLVHQARRAAGGGAARPAIGVTALFGAMLALPALRVTGPVPGDGDAGLRHHHPDPDQRDDLPHRRPAGHQARQAAAVRRTSSTSASSTGWWRCCWCSRWWWCTASCARTSGRAFEALRGSPVASDCMGVVGLPLQGLRLRDQRRLRRPGRQPVRVFGAVHLAQHLQLRADRAVPAGRHHGRAQDAASAR